MGEIINCRSAAVKPDFSLLQRLKSLFFTAKRVKKYKCHANRVEEKTIKINRLWYTLVYKNKVFKRITLFSAGGIKDGKKEYIRINLNSINNAICLFFLALCCIFVTCKDSTVDDEYDYSIVDLGEVNELTFSYKSGLYEKQFNLTMAQLPIKKNSDD